MRNTFIAFLVLVIAGLSVYIWNQNKSPRVDIVPVETTATTTVQGGNTQPTDTVQVDKTKTVIGTSVEGRAITAYHFGEGETELLFVGGIHGGYEWNTVLVADQLMNHLITNPDIIPKNVKVTVIPLLNPDGLNKVVTAPVAFVPGAAVRFSPTDVATSKEKVTSGRFNGNTVDLNRNFDCDWQASATWQTKTVSGGTKVFSEPESQAIKQYVETSKPDAVVVWYSAAGGVFSSNCHNGVSAETKTLTKLFADASRYPAFESFNFYEITGDMVNWLAKNNVPAISVLLTNHTDTEWTKNQAGVEALLKYYAK